jgi:hypothetical protein
VNRDVLDLFCSWLMVRFEFSDPEARNFRRDPSPKFRIFSGFQFGEAITPR